MDSGKLIAVIGDEVRVRVRVRVRGSGRVRGILTVMS